MKLSTLIINWRSICRLEVRVYSALCDGVVTIRIWREVSNAGLASCGGVMVRRQRFQNMDCYFPVKVRKCLIDWTLLPLMILEFSFRKACRVHIHIHTAQSMSRTYWQIQNMAKTYSCQESLLWSLVFVTVDETRTLDIQLMQIPIPLSCLDMHGRKVLPCIASNKYLLRKVRLIDWG